MMATIVIKKFKELEEAHGVARTLLRMELQRQGGGPHAVLLPGGGTPLPIYRAIAEQPFPVGSSVRIAYTDERHVPPDAPDSNFGATIPLLRALEIPEERVFRVPTELPLEDAADEYDRILHGFLASGGQISLGLLGLGADGHTCSLFSDADLERGRGRLACAVPRPAPPHRISVTPDLLERIDRIVLLVLGADKKEIVHRLLQDPASVPAGKAIMKCRHVELWRT